MRKSKQVAYRRQEVSKMLVKGSSQHDIAKVLGITQPTVSRDVNYLEGTAREELKTLIQKRLPHQHAICIRGIGEVLKYAWITVSETKSETVKLNALGLISDCYTMKLNLLGDANIINGALEFVEKSKEQLREQKTTQEDTKPEEEVF